MPPVAFAVPPSLRRLAALTLALACAVTFWAALQPSLAPPDAYEADKIIHTSVFALLSALAALAARSRRGLLFGALGLVALGAAIEVGQSMVPGRTASLLDLAGDALGVLLGMAVAGLAGRLWRRSQRLAP